MSVSQVPPLSSNVPIVYPPGHPSAGCPTPAFATLMQILLDEKAVTDALAEGAIQPGTVTTSGLTAAAQRILGNKEATTGAIEELTVTEALDLIAGTAAQGDIFYRGATSVKRLPAGTSGQFLKTLGAGADPAWGTVSGGGGGYEAGPSGTVPTTASMTQLNFGTSTATDGSGALIFSPQLGATVPRYLLQSAPAGSFDVYARIEIGQSSTAAATAFLQAGAGIVLRNSANNEVVSWEFSEQRNTAAPYGLWFNGSFRINGANSGTYGTAYLSTRFDTHTWRWLRLGWNSGTGIATFYRSPDGKNWISVGTASVSANLGTPNQIGMLARAEANDTAMVAVYSYFSTTAPS